MTAEIKAEIIKRRKFHARGQRLWSFGHHATTFGAAILSLTAAALAQAQTELSGWVNRDALIAGLALAAAILAALGAKGGFERKWIANRMTRSQLDVLMIETIGDDVDPKVLKDTLKRVIIEHDEKISGLRP